MARTEWSGPLPKKDDFGDEYKDVMYDGKTRQGPWANMTEKSWLVHGIGRLGTGYGQKYFRDDSGKWVRWIKVEG